MENAEVRQFDSGGVFLSLDGVTVSLTRNDDTGQLYVYINTEDNEEYDKTDESPEFGNPFIQVDLNDAKLYDLESPEQQAAAQALRNTPSE